ncbi:protein kinase [Nocardia puris]|uniref:non-specific serine/threonine protein kinase n=1 Tax=Nocardia puris TaxID=208602 RepID=A0A366DTG7_9NOCA|nr:serine/threonine-protein kinase [Nocardia puris]MBF6364545.1 protein kinase [Nocardia puris]MBF6459474.1 protein kinase [Nocardia puris]RBO92564.1 serine/threonine-protein kinase [Nocardia puris]
MLDNGAVFAGYTVERLLGRGGMGSVYLARHPRLPRLTALKLLNRELFHDNEIRARFEREADLVARLDHPNIVTVFDRGIEDEQLWISMRYVEGEDAASLDAWHLPPHRAVRIVAETAKALDFAHGKGVLHRDVKPANILLERADAGERVFLTDFGIARLRDDKRKLTQTGTFTATLAFASPEQLSGVPLDHRSDQYSLACTLFRLLTGAVPFEADNPVAVIQGHMQRQPPPLASARPGLPVALDAVLARALAKRPADRFDSCTEFAAAAWRALAAPDAPGDNGFGAPVTAEWGAPPKFVDGPPLAPGPSAGQGFASPSAAGATFVPGPAASDFGFAHADGPGFGRGRPGDSSFPPGGAAEPGFASERSAEFSSAGPGFAQGRATGADSDSYRAHEPLAYDNAAPVRDSDSPLPPGPPRASGSRRALGIGLALVAAVAVGAGATVFALDRGGESDASAAAITTEPAAASTTTPTTTVDSAPASPPLSGSLAERLTRISTAFPGMTPPVDPDGIVHIGDGFNGSTCFAHDAGSPNAMDAGAPDFGDFSAYWYCFGGDNKANYQLFVYEDSESAQVAIDHLPGYTVSTAQHGPYLYRNYLLDDNPVSKRPRMVTWFSGDADRATFLLYSVGFIATREELMAWWQSAPLS